MHPSTPEFLVLINGAAYPQHNPDCTKPLERRLVTMVFRMNPRKKKGGGGEGLSLPLQSIHGLHYVSNLNLKVVTIQPLQGYSSKFEGTHFIHLGGERHY